MPLDPTPADLGYRMPAEWEPHAATWLAWPHKRESWPGRFESIPSVWAALAAILAESERVEILAGGREVFAQARTLVGNIPGVVLHDIATDDAWMRDHGPTFLAAGAGMPGALVNWKYNAWGGKYPPYDLDDQVPKRIAELTSLRRFDGGMVLEGGAIDVNGRGALLTSEQCLLNPNRNPDLSRLDIEARLADCLAARHVIWLGEGIAGDDTDGHVDELARFVGPRVVVAALESDPLDENYRPLADNWRRLKSAVDEEGRPLEVVPLPMPRPIFVDGQRLPAGYCNFYIANRAVVVPQFDDPADAIALETLRRAFPGRAVVGQRAVELSWGLGAFHCITQQQPVH
jgi:agmatine deiminase